MANRVYHWKHGWIPLDHIAAISKAKGSESGARKYLTAVNRSDLPRDTHVNAENKPAFNPNNPLEFYGDRLSVADHSKASEEHLADLEKFSEHTHTTLRNHFASKATGGIYVGDKPVPDLDDLGHLRADRPRGWKEGETWDNVPGAYDPSTKVCACGGGGKGHGATSLALHEGSHALDDALGGASRSPEFVKVYHDLHGTVPLTPYFTHPGNPSGYLSEGFAEGFAAWNTARGENRDDQIDAIARALYSPHAPRGPQTREAFGKLADYFSSLDESMRSK